MNRNTKVRFRTPFQGLAIASALLAVVACAERIVSTTLMPPTRRYAREQVAQPSGPFASLTYSGKAFGQTSPLMSTDVDARVGLTSISGAPPATCTLGPACGQSSITRSYSNWLPYASTYTNQNGIALTLNSLGILQRGYQFPVSIRLSCFTVLARNCADATSYGQTCATESNYIDLESIHTALLSDDLYTGYTSYYDDCTYSVNGGSGGSGTQCFTEYLTLEIWQGGNWVYYKTIPVTTCV